MKALFDHLKFLGFDEPDEFNSNNGWGFGGAAGYRVWHPDHKILVTIATASTRHQGGTKFIKIRHEGRTLLDEVQSKRALERAIQIVDQLVS